MERNKFDPFVAYNVEKDGEFNDGPIITESAGYVNANVLIENMIYAGERLNLARQEMYDFPDGTEVDESFIDPTRHPGTDVVDAEYAARAVNGRLAEQRVLYEKEMAARAEAEIKAEAVKND